MSTSTYTSRKFVTAKKKKTSFNNRSDIKNRLMTMEKTSGYFVNHSLVKTLTFYIVTPF